MGLNLYYGPNENKLLSSLNPFSVTFDGRLGGAQDHLIYIRNNAKNRWYSSITLEVVDTDGTSRVDGSQTGWYWKLMEKEIAPVNEEWYSISPGNILTLSTDLGNSYLADTVTYIPVWIRVEIPRGQNIQTITDIVLRLKAQEHII